MAWLQDLPLELFISILDAVIHTTHPKDHSTNLKTILLVSKEWNDVSQSISSLWLTLSSADPPAWVERVLRNSSPDGPLNVRFVRYVKRRVADRWFERMVASYIARWVDLRMDWPHDAWDAAAISAWAPRLQRISAYCPKNSTPRKQLFRDQFMQHRSLSLDNQLVPGHPRSTSLQRFFIYKDLRSPPGYTPLLETLISYPNLVQLVIHNASSASTFNGPSFIMAQLTHIDLQLSITTITCILQWLRLPALVKFSVVILSNGTYRNPAHWTLLLETITPILLRLVEREQKSLEPLVALQLSGNGWVLKVRSGSFVFGTPYRDVSYLRSLLSPLGDVSAAVVCSAEGDSGEVFAVQHVLPNTIYLRLPCSDYTMLYHVFRRMTTSLSGRTTGLLSKLRTLELTWEPKLVAASDLLVPIEKLMEARRTMVIRYPKVGVEDGLGELRRKFPNSFVFTEADAEVAWWDRPGVPMDLDYENYSFVGEEERW